MVFLHIGIVSSSYIIILSGMGHTCQFWGLWSRFMGQWVTVVFYGVSIHQYSQFIIYHHCIWYGRWRANLGGSGDAFKGWWVTVVFDGVSLHQYGQIIIYHLVSGMGDDVPILGAVVTLLKADGYFCFWWCFYISVWLDHLISSFYLVWVIRPNFGGSGHAFKCWW